jgi:endonuclease/exonuclease/phosphatase family metal-dependent hydrolase
MKKLFVFAILALLSSAACAQQKDAYKVMSIGFYNLENLFDTVDSPVKIDEEFLPTSSLQWNTAKYMAKEGNLAHVISQLATDVTPDGVALLGVAEVENRKVLEDLVSQSELKARGYQIIHIQSPDVRGISTGLLYQPKYFTVTTAKALFVDLRRPTDTVGFFTRDVLYVAGMLDGEPVHIMVNHWPSRRGGETASAWARAVAANICRHVADSLSQANPNAKVIIMGDLNDDPDSKSLTDVLKAKGDSKDLKPGDLFNTMYPHYKSGDGTMAYKDAWSLFDQMIISQTFFNKGAGGWNRRARLKGTRTGRFRAMCLLMGIVITCRCIVYL